MTNMRKKKMNPNIRIGKIESATASSPAKRQHILRLPFLLLLGSMGIGLMVSGCTFLTYTGANGERISRGALGASTAIASLSLETSTNGVRRVEMHGYQSEATQAMGAVTEAAVRAALQGVK
jgi:hypothetical protein